MGKQKKRIKVEGRKLKISYRGKLLCKVSGLCRIMPMISDHFFTLPFAATSSTDIVAVLHKDQGSQLCAKP